jgi:hypothetical protein
MEQRRGALPQVYVLWHPRCALGAPRIRDWLRPGNGLGPPEVFNRSLPAPDVVGTARKPSAKQREKTSTSQVFRALTQVSDCIRIRAKRGRRSRRRRPRRIGPNAMKTRHQRGTLRRIEEMVDAIEERPVATTDDTAAPHQARTRDGGQLALAVHPVIYAIFTNFLKLCYVVCDWGLSGGMDERCGKGVSWHHVE